MAQNAYYQENQRMRTPSAASLVDSAPPSTLYIHSMQPLNVNQTVTQAMKKFLNKNTE